MGCCTNTYNSTIYTYKLIEGVYTTTEPRIRMKTRTNNLHKMSEPLTPMTEPLTYITF